ncbi:MAG: NAD(P)/FAD-dependent oxidoreductase [Pedobacter sp.]|nr:MAG: NAD(P)/FAD-dependent oxidoreductase [Pedobacter sp.]
MMKNFFLGPFTIPRHPFAAARFGFYGFQSSDFFTKRYFKDERTRLMFAGISAHSMMPLNKPLTNSFGLLMAALGHVAGWPLAKGGSQKIADALQAYFISLGGQIINNHPVNSLKDIPPAKAILFDLTPKQILKIVGDKFPENYRKKLAKYRYGAGVFKIDWALSSPIPFKNPECSLASTVHLGGTQQEIIDSEKSLVTNKHSESPFVILTQNSLFDSSRAPKDKHTAWAYCHVPNGSTFDMTEIIENKIEKFAPGFKECILQRHTMNTVQIEQYNPNYIGGDINGGIQDIWQFYSRPVLRISPYTTPVKGIYICSSSTPPGGGVHGMCGYHAAQAVLKDIFS